MQREFKKLKSQINHIEEIAHNSKVGALIEQESSLRKKIRQLIDMEDEGFYKFKDYYFVAEAEEQIFCYLDVFVRHRAKYEIA